MVGCGMLLGPYAKAVLQNELGLPATSLSNCEPSETFDGGHPDPNLVYAHEVCDGLTRTRDARVRLLARISVIAGMLARA